MRNRMSDALLTQINHFVREHLPLAAEHGFQIESLGQGRARARMPHSPQHLRAGGTISGPAQMGLADFIMYIAIMAQHGRLVDGVTASLNINFLRRPAPRDLIADARCIRAGRRLAVAEVTLFSDGDPEPVAHATATYAMTPEKR